MDGAAGEAGRQEGAASSSGALTSPEAPVGGSSSRLGAAGGGQGFDGALAELKDLQSQLHQAADCYEEAFINAEKKKLILESTKSYICNAVVAVIDHLGTVTSKLEHQLEDKTEITRTEQKINFLKQRLLTCEQYAISLKLLTVRGDAGTIQYHRRYLSQTDRTKERNGANNSSQDDPKRLEIISTALPGATRTLKPYDVQSTTGRECAVAAGNVGSPREGRPSFSFRAEDVHIVLGDHKKKASHGSNIMSFLKKKVGGIHNN